MPDDEMTRAESILAGQRRMDAATPKLSADATRAERMLAEESLAYANKLLDAAVIAEDKQRIATMAEDGIVPPGYALMAIETVDFFHKTDDRPRSVWLADRAKCAATSPVRMAEIYEDVHGLFGFEVANKEPMDKLEDAIWNKELDASFAETANEIAGARWGDDQLADERTLEIWQAAEQEPTTMHLQDEELRPVLRLGRSVRL